jgi:PPOX class probable F420-dependent enzyme
MNKTTIEINPQIRKRLEEEPVIWLTTVSSDGSPKPNPVWFYWDGDCFVIYTPPASAKVKNISRNARVSLNLAATGALGGDVVIFAGEAHIRENVTTVDPGYAGKYLAAAQEWGRTPEDLPADYSVEIRITPTKLRSDM